MAAVTEIGTLIDRDLAVRGGRPKIARTGISVSRVAGMTEEEILDEHPDLQRGDFPAVYEYAAEADGIIKFE